MEQDQNTNDHFTLKLLLFVSGKPCLIPQGILHATLSHSGVVVFGDEPVTVTCDVGYGINGNSTQMTQAIRCMADGTFGEPQPCLGGFVWVYFTVSKDCINGCGGLVKQLQHWTGVLGVTGI